MKVGNGLSLELGKYQKQVNLRLKIMQDQDFSRRLWDREEGLWRNTSIRSEVACVSMGWLTVVDKMMECLPDIEVFCKEVHRSGYTHAVLLGMGGSSMTPLVFQRTFYPENNSFNNPNPGLKLIVLDSTEPEMIRKAEAEIDISKTLFIVSSKSGTTAEVLAFYHYFYARLFQIKKEKASENFIAITDTGSPLVELAIKNKFRNTFINFECIGGRYSALSYFGILPAALMGLDVKQLLERTKSMIKACGPQVPASQNPGIILGATIAELASQGCDKLTYLLPAAISSFGLWLEQLLAESTGKNGKGIMPLNGDPLIEMDAYGTDRFFFQLELPNVKRDAYSERLKDFVAHEHPLIKIQMEDELDIGQEFFRWEVATATAGAILGVDPFDQPNVQESKKCTDQLLKKIETEGEVLFGTPLLVEDSVRYYSGISPKDKAFRVHSSENETRALSLMRNFLSSASPGNYISIQAYLPETEDVSLSLSGIQQLLQKRMKLAVTTEFGPRYLHSTGQYYKGGPNNGIFIQFIGSSCADVLIPGQTYSFGALKNAQAMGDMQALLAGGRRVILIDLGKEISRGLSTFKHILEDMDLMHFEENIGKRKVEVPTFLLDRNKNLLNDNAGLNHF